MALVLPIFLLVVLATVDIWPALADLIIAKNLSARGARAAAVVMPNEDCPLLVESAIGTPKLFMADFTYEISPNCVLLPTIAQGEEVWVNIDLEYHPSFWPGPWNFIIVTSDWGR